MFQLDPAPTFDASVSISVPGQADGIALQVTFRHKRKTAIADWISRARGRSDAEILDEVIERWSGVHNAAGKDVPYSREALDTLLENYPAAKDDLFQTYLRELTEAKRKN
ncbi:MAG: hypothetical protein RL375_756 [Pseudomonadota bacterium]|jgi:hypothetical protein